MRAAAVRRDERRRRTVLAPVDAFSRSLAAGLRRQLIERSAAVSLGDVDGLLVAAVVGLCAFGLVMVYSASEPLGYTAYGDSAYFFRRQVMAMALGAVLMIAAAKLDYHRWREWARFLAVGVAFLLAAVLVPHIGTEALGARRWIGVGPFTFQPSAIATMVAIIYFSRWLCDRGPAIRTWTMVRRYLILLVLVVGAIVLERDLGSAIVLSAIGLWLLVLGGARKRGIAFAVGVMLVLGYFAIRMEAYRSSRLQSFRDPFSDPLNTGFQPIHAMFALGTGGLRGVGLGNSVEKYLWLPEAHSDFIFAIIGEELGLIGTLAVIGAFSFLLWRGVRTALRAPDRFGTLLAGGITAWIGIQAFINMAAVTNVSPTTGITLPFISFGGTSLVSTLLAVGVLCNISAQGRRHQGEARRAHVDRWRGDGWTHHARDRAGDGAALDGSVG
jgi:cell division protein FtsW